MDTERGIIICRGVSALRGVIQIEISAYLAANFNGGWKAYIDRVKHVADERIRTKVLAELKAKSLKA